MIYYAEVRRTVSQVVEIEAADPETARQMVLNNEGRTLTEHAEPLEVEQPWVANAERKAA